MPFHKQLIPPATGYDTPKDHPAEIGLLPTPTSIVALLTELSVNNPAFQQSGVRHARPAGTHVRTQQLHLPNYIDAIARGVFGPNWNSERRDDINSMLEHLYLLHILTSAWQKATDPHCPTYISGVPIEASEIPTLDAMLDKMYDDGTTYNALPIGQQTLLREILRRMLLQYNDMGVHRAWISNHTSQTAADAARVDLVRREAAHRAATDTTVMERGYRQLAVHRAINATKHAKERQLQQLMQHAARARRNLRTERDDAHQACRAATDLGLVTKETTKQEMEQLEARIEQLGTKINEQEAELHRAEDAARQMRTNNHAHLLEAARRGGGDFSPEELTRQIEAEAAHRREELETLVKQRDEALKLNAQLLAASERAMEAMERTHTQLGEEAERAILERKAVTERYECVICRTNERDTMLSPCHHIPCCNACWQEWSKVAPQRTCPMCREPVTHATRVYLSV